MDAEFAEERKGRMRKKFQVLWMSASSSRITRIPIDSIVRAASGDEKSFTLTIIPPCNSVL